MLAMNQLATVALFWKKDASSVKIKEDDTLDKATESPIVVAALIAMIIFATAYTLSSGYKNKKYILIKVLQF